MNTIHNRIHTSIVAFACAAAMSNAEPTARAQPPVQRQPIDVRAIDWLTRTYNLGTIDEMYTRPFSVRNGMEEWTDAGQSAWFAVRPPTFGDLTGDGTDEAVIVTTFCGGGTGRFSEILVFGVERDRAVLVGRVPGGDRPDGGIHSAAVDAGVLVVRRLWPSQGAGDAEKIAVETWRYRDARFIEMSPPPSAALLRSKPNFRPLFHHFPAGVGVAATHGQTWLFPV